MVHTLIDVIVALGIFGLAGAQFGSQRSRTARIRQLTAPLNAVKLRAPEPWYLANPWRGAYFAAATYVLLSAFFGV